MEAVDFNNMRRAMVDSQLRTSGVTTPWVIAAMGELRREEYVPEALRSNAYMDRSFSGDSALNPPVATALMLQAAEVAADDRVLLVGTPNGYVATLLSARTNNVIAIETLADLPTAADFSLVIIDGAVEELPDNVLAVAREGARIVTGVFEHGVTRLASGIVRGGKVALRPFADTEIAVLPEFAKTREFVF
jgi:protein-L-isoaspartate(D-aspartate) O-methyltransferase